MATAISIPIINFFILPYLGEPTGIERKTLLVDF